MITIKLKRGSGIPTADNLNQFEMGWSVDQKKLYINDGGTIKIVANSDLASLDFDNAPTDGSNNLLTSNTVYDSLQLKVDKNGTDRLITLAEASKLNDIEADAQVNIIESIELNGSTLPIVDKVVNVDGVEVVSNKVTSFSETTTDVNYPSEKLVKDSLDLKLTKSVVDGGTTGLIDNTGGSINISNEISGGQAVKLHFGSGESYLVKYATGDSVVYSDGNKLLNKAEVAAMITGDASRLITSRSGTEGSYSYLPFETYSALVSGPLYYQGVEIPETSLTSNDYVYVQDDENHDNLQTMYVWDGSAWVYSVSFSEEPLVADNDTLEVYDTKYIRIKDGGVGVDQLLLTAQDTASGFNRLIAYNSSNVPKTIIINDGTTYPNRILTPTNLGTEGQYILADENGLPYWEDHPTIPTIKLNNVFTTSPSFYAPTVGGTSGEVLISNGSGNQPIWTDILSGGTWD